MAMVGCGAVADIYHLPALRRVPGAELAAVVDADPERARAAARRHGATSVLAAYTELPGRVDAAIVATPNATHGEIASYLLGHGIHVLCEKPMATTPADAETMRAAAARGGARLMAGQCRRFSPSMEALKSLLDTQRLGPLHRLRAALGGRYGDWPQRTDFRRQRSLAGGGVLLDLGVHLIDLVLWLAGPQVSLLAYHSSDRLGWGVETDADLVLGLRDGGEARLSCSYTHGLDRTLHVEGADGWATTSVDPAPAVTFFSRRARVCRRAGVQRLAVDEADPYARQLAHFLDCLRRDAPFLVEDTDILAGLEIIERCYGLARAA